MTQQSPTRERAKAVGPATRGRGPLALPFDLFSAKLTVPATRPGVVRRTALVNRLLAAPQARVVTVLASAGFGKTTLVTQWGERDRRPFAWVTLDARDNDPVVLVAYVAAALDRVAPLPGSVRDALATPGVPLWSTLVPRLCAAWREHDPAVVLVLEDVHLLSEPECLDVVGALCEHVGEESVLALCGRSSSSDLPIARLRAADRLLEVGPTDLALGRREGVLLLRGTGVELAEDDAAELTRKTEGWAAGLYLAALSLKQAGPDGATVASFGGRDRFVTDYFRSEHLSRLSPRQLAFLTRTAVLERMCGPLCDAILDRRDSARMLEWIERQYLFLVPLDHERVWYRYHHLFRDLLLGELERREPGAAAALRRRAAAWFADEGLVEEAIDYACEAGDLDHAAELVEAIALPYNAGGRIATCEAWFELLDDPSLLLRHPGLGVIGAWLHALRGRPAEAERWAIAAENATLMHPLPDGSETIRPWIAVLRAAFCADGPERMREWAAIAVAELPPASQWRGAALMVLGASHVIAGELERADEVFAELLEVAPAVGAQEARIQAFAQSSLLALGRGDGARAQALADRALAEVDAARMVEYPSTVLPLAASARSRIARHDRERARADVARALRLRALLTDALPWLAVQARLELADVQMALGDVSGARTLLAEIDEILASRPRLGTLVARTDALRLRLDGLEAAVGSASSLTSAELRLLPLLTTHLSFREIGERLYISRNTVKTQAISIYRKLDASARSEAIERAVELGLVDGAVAPRSAGLVPTS